MEGALSKDIDSPDNTKYWQTCSAIRNSDTLPTGMQNGTAAPQNSVVISYKVKHILTIRPSNSTPEYFKEMKTYVHTKICIQIHKCL